MFKRQRSVVIIKIKHNGTKQLLIWKRVISCNRAVVGHLFYFLCLKLCLRVPAHLYVSSFTRSKCQLILGATLRAIYEPLRRALRQQSHHHHNANNLGPHTPQRLRDTTTIDCFRKLTPHNGILWDWAWVFYSNIALRKVFTRKAIRISLRAYFNILLGGFFTLHQKLAH